MIFSVSNDDIEWSPDISPVSVACIAKNLAQEFTISSQKLLVAAYGLLLSQRLDNSNNYLAPVPITPNQKGTTERRDEVFSKEGAGDMDASGYQVFDLDIIEFH